MDAEKVERRYRRLKAKVEAQLQELQLQRLQCLAPSRLYLPVPWQPVIYEQAVTMYKVVAAQGGQFTSVFDSRVVYELQQWTYARCGCGSDSAWPPLWSCMYAFPSEHQARSAVFPRGSQQHKGARVLCRVTVQGKGYLHPDGRVAVSGIRLDQLLQYVPKGPTDKVVSSLSYDDAIGRASIRTAGVTLVEQQQQRESRTGRPPAVQLVRQLEEAAWDVEEA